MFPARFGGREILSYCYFLCQSFGLRFFFLILSKKHSELSTSLPIVEKSHLPLVKDCCGSTTPRRVLYPREWKVKSRPPLSKGASQGCRVVLGTWAPRAVRAPNHPGPLTFPTKSVYIIRMFKYEYNKFCIVNSISRKHIGGVYIFGALSV